MNEGNGEYQKLTINKMTTNKHTRNFGSLIATKTGQKVHRWNLLCLHLLIYKIQ